MAGDRIPRKAVKLPGTAAFSAGQSFEVEIVDLSYEGCKVVTPIALEPGISLELLISGLSGKLEAIVRWSKAGNAGLQFVHEAEEDTQPEHPPRQQERIRFDGKVTVRRPGREHYELRMFDLSRTGCRVEFVERPKVGETVWTKLEGLESIESVVRWVDGFYGGLEFVRPIHEGVFSILLRKMSS